jgi:endonuclease YncB( thermonuclease family)
VDSQSVTVKEKQMAPTSALNLNVIVVKNHDGDTLSVMYDQLPLIVRLYGIDAPEVTKGIRLNLQAKKLNFPTATELQQVGLKAKAYLTSLLPTNVVLELKATPIYDTYGRIVGKINKIVNMNEEMVRVGLAMVSTSGVVTDPFLLNLIELEKVAKASKIGIWIYQ